MQMLERKLKNRLNLISYRAKKAAIKMDKKNKSDFFAMFNAMEETRNEILPLIDELLEKQ